VPVEDTNELIWVMYISINPGAPLGGSVGQFYPGTFNGTHFEAFDAAARIDGFGKDNYASQFFFGTPANESISLGWASNVRLALVLLDLPKLRSRSLGSPIDVLRLP